MQTSLGREGIYLLPREPFFLKPEDLPWSRKINSDRPSTQEEDMGSQSRTKDTEGRHLPMVQGGMREGPFPGPNEMEVER